MATNLAHELSYYSLARLENNMAVSVLSAAPNWHPLGRSPGASPEYIFRRMAQTTRSIPILIAMLAMTGHAAAGVLHAAITDFAVTYSDEDGTAKKIDVGKRCADLWVAPDESALAFIAIEAGTGLLDHGEPDITKSTIYITRKSNHFLPERIAAEGAMVKDLPPSPFRYPSLSPNQTLLFFSMDDGGEWTILAYDRRINTVETLSRGRAYCTVWEGPFAGAVLVYQRYPAPGQTAPPNRENESWANRCVVRAPGRKETIGSCSEFGSGPGSHLPLNEPHGAACSKPPR
jgi:hypothetical protein